jgi:ubiquitin
LKASGLQQIQAQASDPTTEQAQVSGLQQQTQASPDCNTQVESSQASDPA